MLRHCKLPKNKQLELMKYFIGDMAANLEEFIAICQ